MDSDERPWIDPELREEMAVQHVQEALVENFADTVPAEEVEQAVTEARERYADAPVRDFVPNLVERDARDRLAAADDSDES